jgi:hypothetical protein
MLGMIKSEVANSVRVSLENSPLPKDFFQTLGTALIDQIVVTNPRQDYGVDLLFTNSVNPLVAQCKNYMAFSAVDVRQHRLNTAQLNDGRELLRLAESDIRAYLDIAGEFFDLNSFPYHLSEEQCTAKFEEIDSQILETDDWVSWLNQGYSESLLNCAEIQNSLWNATFRHVQGIVVNLTTLLAHISGIRRYLDLLCHLALSLICNLKNFFCIFLLQMRWFLQHTAHPPHLSTAIIDVLRDHRAHLKHSFLIG